MKTKHFIKLKKSVKAIICFSMIVIFACETTVKADEKEVYEDERGKITYGIGTIDEQVEQLCSDMSYALNLNERYIRAIYNYEFEDNIYIDSVPNIYADLMIYKEGANIANVEMIKNPWVETGDKNIQRPNVSFLPDIMYSECVGIVRAMNNRYNADRGYYQSYFDALDKDSKVQITFMEAMMKVHGATDEEIDKAASIYETIIYNKCIGENVVKGETTDIEFKDNYEKIIIDSGITDKAIIDIMAYCTSFDLRISKVDNVEALRTKYVIPYKSNYTSKENLMIAAMSLVNKCRYVWGGGHKGAASINGINPLWLEFDNLYGDIDNCIKSKTGYCPIHGALVDCNCSLSEDIVHSVEDIEQVRKEVYGESILKDEKFELLLRNVFEKQSDTREVTDICMHQLEGLDCSGYVAWCLNQVTEGLQFNSTAIDMCSNENNFDIIDKRDKLLPADIISWNTHVIMVVGNTGNDNTYIHIEQTPDTVRFGVTYNYKATKDEIEEAIEIAKQANELLGGTHKDNRINIFNLETLGKVSISDEDNSDEQIEELEENESDNIVEIEETNEETSETDEENEEASEEVKETLKIGRLKVSFIDKDILHNEKTIDEMTAVEIIQNTVDKVSMEYVSGVEKYKREDFDVRYFDTENIGSQVQKYVQENNFETKLIDME